MFDIEVDNSSRQHAVFSVGLYAVSSVSVCGLCAELLMCNSMLFLIRGEVYQVRGLL